MSTNIYHIDLDWVIIEKIAVRVAIILLAVQCDALNSFIGLFIWKGLLCFPATLSPTLTPQILFSALQSS